MLTPEVQTVISNWVRAAYADRFSCESPLIRVERVDMGDAVASVEAALRNGRTCDSRIVMESNGSPLVQWHVPGDPSAVVFSVAMIREAKREAA